MTDEEAAVYRRLLKAKKIREKFFEGVFYFFTGAIALVAMSIIVCAFLYVKLYTLEKIFLLDSLFISVNLVVIIERFKQTKNIDIIPVEMYSFSAYNLASPFEPYVKALFGPKEPEET